MEEWKFERSLTEDRSDNSLGPVWSQRERLESPFFEGREGANIWATGPAGELRARIVDLIDASGSLLCLASFLFAEKDIEDALIRAAERGTRVYLLSAYDLQFEQASEQDSGFLQQRLEESKQTLDRLAGKVLVRSSDHLHTKMIVSDPKDRGSSQGILLTANLTTDALTRNPELGVEVPHELAYDMYAQFCRGFWLESKHELLEPGQLRAIEESPIRNIEPPFGLLVTDTETNTLKEALLEQIRDSTGGILASCYGLSPGHPVTKAVIQAAKQGRQVTILTRPRPVPEKMEALIELAKAGAKVLGHPWLHAKALVTQSDGKYEGIVMTANIEERGLDEGFEMGVRLVEEDARDMQKVLLNWTASFPQELILDGTPGQLSGQVSRWIGGELLKVTVKDTWEMDVGELEAATIESMEDTKPTSFPSPTGSDVLYRKHLYRWTVVPPRLPRKAKLAKEKHSLPVFELRKEKFVAIQKKSQLQKANELAKELGARVVVSEPEKGSRKRADSQPKKPMRKKKR